MKTNKQFIDGIYEKYDEYSKEKTKKYNVNKIINMAAVIVVLFSSLIVLTGCENEEPPIIQKGEIEETKISLQTIGSFENFYQVIKEKTSHDLMTDYSEEKNVIQDTVSESVSSNTSKTNKQVENVDESDVVKTEGNYIYYVSEDKLVIIDAKVPETSEKITEINYEEEQFLPREIYVKNNKLIVLGNETENYTATCKTGSLVVEDLAMNRSFKTGLIIYDITDIKNPKEIRRVMVDGNYVSSRMIENNIYFVANKYIYASSLLKDNIEVLNENDYKPKYQDTAISKEEKSINFDQIYCLEETRDTSYLMLIGLNLENNEQADIRTFLGAGQHIYSSQKNMYIATNKIQYGEGYEVLGGTTYILKFKLNNGTFQFIAESNINGQINNQFSMDEKDDTFRIATTTGNIWIDSTTANSLYILNDKLEEIGKVTDFGKEEKIYSVRYIGNKAYVVTFKQTDPLFVIDLSNPVNPQILGELKIPGYSTYLHPYDETHLIGFGYETKEDGTRITTNGLKMVMFDITDFNNPKEMFKVTIGDRYTDSPLIYNHKALLYSKEKNIIGFPLNSYENRKRNSKAVIYEIDLEKGFTLKGEIANIVNEYKKEVERVIFVNNTYYTLSKVLVKVASIETLGVIKEIEI